MPTAQYLTPKKKLFLTKAPSPFSQTFIHIPTPGDHYSPATGSAIPTIIYEISRWHDRAGGTTHILVGKGTRHDYPIGECVEVDFTAPPGKPQKAMDAILGKLGVGRPFGAAAYRPASKAIPQHFDGPIFLHNSPVA